MPERMRHAPLDLKDVRRLQAEIHIIKDQCKGCGYCIEYCPKNVLEESQEINARGVHLPKVVDESACIICNFCTAVCPDFAIFVIEKKDKETNKK